MTKAEAAQARATSRSRKVCVSPLAIPVLGNPVEQCDVFYLNYENPRDEFLRRRYRIAHSLALGATEYDADGVTYQEWHDLGPARKGPWQVASVHPIDTSRFHARHLRDEVGAHLMRITAKGQIIQTRFGRQFFDMLDRHAGHKYVIFDGLMDAILFEGSTRSEDDVARQVISMLD